MDAIRLDQLPDLCLRKVFAFLSLRSRAKCRSVCRLFKFYADETRVDELVVQYSRDDSRCSDTFSECRVWYLTDRELDFRNSITRVGFSSMRCLLKLNERLRFLHVHLGYSSSFDFKLLNDLKQLVHLEIRLQADGDVPKTLALPNLKVFDVQSLLRHDSYVLNTPKLEVLACNEIKKIQVEHPETLKRLECKYSGEPVVSKFKNLEVLTCLEASYHLSPISLSDWNHLKELNLDMVFSWYSLNKYKQFIRWVVSLMSQKAELKRDELKLYLADVLLVDKEQLVYGRMASSEDLMLKNPNYLRPGTRPHVSELQFDRLVELGVELSAEFFDRFSGIQKITVRGTVEPHSLEWFMENVTALRHLVLRGTSLEQTFMEKLPNVASQLKHLEVLSEGFRLITDFHFILRLEHLCTFKTDHQFDSLELMAQACQQLNKFANFKFRDGRLTVEIGRPWDYEYDSPSKEGSKQTTRKDEYRLQINNEYGRRKLLRGRVKWAKLVVLYEQKIAELTKKAGAPVRMKIKRARLG